MTHEQFFHKVEHMRKLQREYFRTRSAVALRDSKRIEQEIDREIERVNTIVQERQNPELDFSKQL